MANIAVGSSLVVTEVNKPLDARTRIATLSDAGSIQNPFVGMRVYVLDEAKDYTVRTLKTSTPDGSPFPIADSQIDSLTPNTLELGETASEAYYGDKGKEAYLHSQASHAPSNAQKNSDILKTEIENVLVGEITSHKHKIKVPPPMLFPLPRSVEGDPALHFMFEAHTTTDYSTTPILALVTSETQVLIKVFDGTAWVPFPLEGVGTPYYGNQIMVTPSTAMLEAQCYIRYKLYLKADGPEDTVWKYTLYPSVIVV